MEEPDKRREAAEAKAVECLAALEDEKRAAELALAAGEYRHAVVALLGLTRHAATAVEILIEAGALASEKDDDPLT